MSNFLAIAAVTTTLQNLLFSGLKDELGSGNITTLPLDKARESSDSNQINLFLYHATPNLAWRNRPKVTQVKRGNTDEPPLGLDLYYLIAAYGQDEDEVASHQLLGRVMTVLHDHKVLTPTEVATATANRLPQSNLHHQLDCLSIVPQSLSFEEISKIWQAFQAQYRTSVAYQVSVVVLDSNLPVQVAPPVLPQSNAQSNDTVRGGAQGIAHIGVPKLRTLHLPNGQRSAQLGDRLSLHGTLLNAPEARVQLQHPHHPEPIQLKPQPDATDTVLRVQLPDSQADPRVVSRWQAGFYTLSLWVPHSTSPRTSEELPLALAPQVLAVSSRRTRAGNLILELTVIPQIQTSQRVVLLLGDRGIAPQAIALPDDPTAPSHLSFRAQKLPPGNYLVRLRVDGVDSIPADFATQPPAFAQNQIIRVTEPD